MSSLKNEKFSENENVYTIRMSNVFLYQCVRFWKIKVDYIGDCVARCFSFNTNNFTDVIFKCTGNFDKGACSVNNDDLTAVKCQLIYRIQVFSELLRPLNLFAYRFSCQVNVKILTAIKA